MSTIKMSEEIDRNRRRFFGTAAMTVAAAQLGMFGSADAQLRKANPADVPTIKPGTNTSFAALKQIDAASSATANTPATSTNSSGRPRHQSGTLMLSTTIAGGLAWLRGSQNTMSSNRNWLKVQSSPYLRSSLKAMPTVRHTRTSTRPIAKNSPANMHSGLSQAASGTICLRKLRRPSPKPSSKSTTAVETR